MEQTKYSRKLDSSGRLMIPIRLREEMGLISGTEYAFFTHEMDGRKFICIECPSITQAKLQEAMQIVQANGMKIVQSDDWLPF